MKGLGRVRVEPDRLIAVLDGAVVFAFVVTGVGAVNESCGGMRVERNGVIGFFYGAVGLALLEVKIANLKVNFCVRPVFVISR